MFKLTNLYANINEMIYMLICLKMYVLYLQKENKEQRFRQKLPKIKDTQLELLASQPVLKLLMSSRLL